jgi:hypothetical protein
LLAWTGVDRASLRADPTTEPVSVPRHPPVDAVGSARKGLGQYSDGEAEGKEASERTCGRTAGEAPFIGGDEMPGSEPLVLAHVGEEPVSLLALDRDCSKLTAPIPSEDLVERPSAKAAVRIVENDVTFHHSRLSQRWKMTTGKARHGTVITTLPIFCPVSTYRYASTIRSKG